jgi:hypothetical protein
MTNIPYVETGIGYGAGLSFLLGILLQVSFHWPAMIIAGIVAGFFVKRYRHAFYAGFFGVAVAWSLLFMIHVELFQAYEIGEFFASLLGIPGFGRFIVSLSIFLGGLLGGTGALVGFSSMDLILEFRRGKEENI